MAVDAGGVVVGMFDELGGLGPWLSWGGRVVCSCWICREAVLGLGLCWLWVLNGRWWLEGLGLIHVGWFKC